MVFGSADSTFGNLKAKRLILYSLCMYKTISKTILWTSRYFTLKKYRKLEVNLKFLDRNKAIIECSISSLSLSLSHYVGCALLVQGTRSGPI